MSFAASAGDLVRYALDRRVTNPMTLPMVGMIGAPFVLLAAGHTNDPRFWPGVALTVGCGFAVYVAAMMLNDVCDLEVDRIAHPERPLPSGRCSPRALTVWAWVLYACAGLAAALWSPLAGAVVLGHLVVSVGHYSYAKTRFKAPGASEFLTALQNAPIPPFCAAMALPLVGSLSPFVGVIAALTLLIYCADVATDMIAGISDEAADFIGNVATMSVTLGARAAALGGAAMAAAALAVGAWLVIRPGANPVLQIGAAAAGIAVVATVGGLLQRPDAGRRIEASYLSLWIFVAWIFIGSAASALVGGA